MKIRNSIENIIKKFDDINEKLIDAREKNDIVKLSREKSEIEDIAEAGNKYIKMLNEIESLEEIIKNSKDIELISLAKDDLIKLKEEIISIEENLKILLIPKDPLDNRNAILEIRSGTGGDEAALFATDLMLMYQRYAENQGWKWEIIHILLTDGTGIKDATIEICGKGVFGKMRFESGTHRVQRVPETENNGRVHTSAATVAVFPEIDDIDIKINESDLRIDIYRSSGAGGQHVNKTESAVRITHIPTGIIVIQQEDRSQIKNREKAMKILRTRLYEHEEEKRISQMAKDRKNQIGSGDRSEKIRTYNFPQNRLTDHRINFTSYNLDQLIKEGKIDELINALRANFQASLLAETND